MQIRSVDIQLQSTHEQSTRLSQSETLNAWIGARPGTDSANQTAQPPASVVVQLSDLGSRALAGEAQATLATADDARASPELQLLKTMVEAMLGVKIKVISVHEVQPTVESADIPDPARARSAAGWGVEYDRHTTYDEQEHTHFSAQGEIRTADGRQIQFSLDLSMTRAYTKKPTSRCAPAMRSAAILS